MKRVLHQISVPIIVLPVLVLYCPVHCTVGMQLSQSTLLLQINSPDEQNGVKDQSNSHDLYASTHDPSDGELPVVTSIEHCSWGIGWKFPMHMRHI